MTLFPSSSSSRNHGGGRYDVDPMREGWIDGSIIRRTEEHSLPSISLYSDAQREENNLNREAFIELTGGKVDR